MVCCLAPIGGGSSGVAGGGWACWWRRRLIWAGVRAEGGGATSGGDWVAVGRPALHGDARQEGRRGSEW